MFKRFLITLNIQPYQKYRLFFSTINKIHDQIIFTEACLNKIYEKTINDSNKLLRISVEGGAGCSGYRYSFKFDNQINEDDYVYEQNQKKFAIIDELTLKLIKGSTIDYEDTMIRSAFYVVENPNAEKSCSCKVSFSPKEGLL